MRRWTRRPSPWSELARPNAWWRAANYQSVGQIYLVDEAANAPADADASIGSPGARVCALVVTAGEDLEIAGLVEEEVMTV
jgi:hypothetical protein